MLVRSSIYINGIDREKEKYDFLGRNRLKQIDSSNFLEITDQFKYNETIAKILTNKMHVDISPFDAYPKIYTKDLTNSKSYYIPTLRSAHSLFQRTEESFTKIENDIYFDTLQKYYPDLDEKVEIFTGLHLYKGILNSRNSQRSIRKSFENFEKFIGTNFFGNKQVDIVAEFNKDKNLIGENDSEFISVHIDGEEQESRHLHNLGDGIQAIIILMYKIFMAENNSIIFIDEPEMNLHPGMQRLFLDQISSNKDLLAKNLTYFISTHSNHFLDLTLEKEHISIYSFSSKSTENEDSSFNIRNVNAGDNSVLKNLGVNNSSVFLANCSIWVEGISDRNYIKAFLKSYIKSLGREGRVLKEDIDYAFFEYAGSNIEHYFFEDIIQTNQLEIISDINSLALNNRIFLLADSDNASKNSKKGKRLKNLEDIKRENFLPYIIWNFREIENILSKEIWREVLISLCNKNLIPKYKEEINQKITVVLNGMNMSSYSKKYIGEFLNDLSEKIGKIGKIRIINESTYQKVKDGFGTLNDKRELSEIILKKELPWDTLKTSKEIESLTIKIYEFITQS
jgi:hypothetical protein